MPWRLCPDLHESLGTHKKNGGEVETGILTSFPTTPARCHVCNLHDFGTSKTSESYCFFFGSGGLPRTGFVSPALPAGAVSAGIGNTVAPGACFCFDSISSCIFLI